MTLAEEMFNKYHPDGSEAIQKNIAEALEDIRTAMKQGKDYCELYMDWTDLPDDWVVKSETLDYLRQNGFTVEKKYDECSNRFALVTWSNKNV